MIERNLLVARVPIQNDRQGPDLKELLLEEGLDPGIPRLQMHMNELPTKICVYRLTGTVMLRTC